PGAPASKSARPAGITTASPAGRPASAGLNGEPDKPEPSATGNSWPSPNAGPCAAEGCRRPATVLSLPDACCRRRYAVATWSSLNLGAVPSYWWIGSLLTQAAKYFTHRGGSA